MISIPDFSKNEAIFRYFEEISEIPRGSGNTARIADYLESFAKRRGLFCYRDGANNVLIRKEATKGKEGAPTVIIQGHTDIVAEKKPHSTKDMRTEGLEIYRDGDFIKAKDTTLGADDGVAVAYALALLDSSDVPHPRIEALFTSDEEIGLIGADAFDASLLSGRIMINIDTDEEGVFTVGCAGGCRADITRKITREDCSLPTFCLSVFGLLGGHSGAEIHKGRANAIKLTAEVLSSLGEIRLVSLEGGNMDNAIPRECRAVFATDAINDKSFSEITERIRQTYAVSDPNIGFSLSPADGAARALSAVESKSIISLICDLPFGVTKMSEELAGLPETSMNIGIVRLTDSEIDVTLSVRSSVSREKLALVERVKKIAERHGADISTRGDYPAWEYKKNSRLCRVATEVFKDMYKKEAEVITIHAGLECGIFSDRIEGLECISLGPDNFDIHTTEERLSISSFIRVYEFLIRVLQNI